MNCPDNQIITRYSTELQALKNQQPIRITKNLDNGNIAILQIVNPQNVPGYVKVMRTWNGPISKRIAALETALRAAKIIYKNYMRKDHHKNRVVK